MRGQLCIKATAARYTVNPAKGAVGRRILVGTAEKRSGHHDSMSGLLADSVWQGGADLRNDASPVRAGKAPLAPRKIDENQVGQVARLRTRMCKLLVPTPKAKKVCCQINSSKPLCILAERVGQPRIRQSPEEKPRTYSAVLHGEVHRVEMAGC